MGGVEPLEISKVGHTVSHNEISVMAPPYWICEQARGLSKGTMASARLHARHCSFSLNTTGALQAATPVLELRGN